MSGTSPQREGKAMIPWILGMVVLLAVAVGMAFWGTAAFAQAKLKPKSGVAQPAGVKVQTLHAGTGVMPGPSDTVSVRYVGRLTSGKVFDQSPAGQTVDFPLNGVVPGFSQGIQKMHQGGKARITIPPALGYPRGTPDGAIPPGSTIVFDVDLVKVTKAQ